MRQKKRRKSSKIYSFNGLLIMNISQKQTNSNTVDLVEIKFHFAFKKYFIIGDIETNPTRLRTLLVKFTIIFVSFRFVMQEQSIY